MVAAFVGFDKKFLSQSDIVKNVENDDLKKLSNEDLFDFVNSEGLNFNDFFSLLKKIYKIGEKKYAIGEKVLSYVLLRKIEIKDISINQKL